MDHFDVIVIGAGPAGSMAGYLLAKAGLNVIIVERGQTPGWKNVSGGLFYSAPVRHLFDGSFEKMPIERAITAHQLVFLGNESSIALDFRGAGTTDSRSPIFSVLRARFDPWLAKQAEDAGASLITGVTVDSLIVEDGQVVGIQAGPDELRSDVVVIAEGTRSLLLKMAGLREDYQAHDVSLGIKEVITLSPTVIQERFQCGAKTGSAYTFVGNTAGVEGGGFLYTNTASLSLGVVVKIDSLCKQKIQPHQALDAFKSHPLIQRLTDGGEVVEYSAQTVHRGGFHLPTRLYGSGFVVVGSAARLTLNNIVTLRGMDFAMLSAEAAVKAILAAKEKGSYLAADLSQYEKVLKETSIYKDWQTFQQTYSLMDNGRLFNLYPDLVAQCFESLFSPTDQPGQKAMAAFQQAAQGQVSTLTLLKDAAQIARGLIL